MSRAQEANIAQQPFDFDYLTEMMRNRATKPDRIPPEPGGFFQELDYDGYQHIRFLPTNAHWAGSKSIDYRLHPFHLGWLFKAPVQLYELQDGMAQPLTFSTDDFEYHGDVKDSVPEHYDMPGVAGFKLNYPLNRPDLHDEVISFVGSSYFRALGQGNAYGISARGLAVDTGLSKAEEFPRFSAFWVSRPADQSRSITVYAALDSASLTGAYRMVITPGVETVIDVTARLFFRNEVQQLGIAPLTSMFLYSDINRAGYDDFRPQVHDSDGLRIVRDDGDVLWRPLNNPQRLASSYFTLTQPQSFGLVQRDRDFDSYQDAEADYERRPSVEVEPQGDWGRGTVRLVEIPSEREINDNIVAYWVPETPVAAGEAREFSYRLRWGDLPVARTEERAVVVATRGGVGGASGLIEAPDSRKFVIDFQGGMLDRVGADDEEIEPVVTISGGQLDVVTLSKVAEAGVWRLVLDVASEPGSVVELSAHIAGYGRKLSEVWLFQWVKP